MATISQLVTSVMGDTGRPDKSNYITRAVKQVVLKFHESDFYPRDRVKDDAVSITPGNRVTVALPERWRKFELVERLSDQGVSFGTSGVYRPRPPEDVFSPYGNLYDQYYQVIGDTVTIASSCVSLDYLRWVYYAYPDLTDSTAKTWITERYEQQIVDAASDLVWRKLGDTSTAQFNRQNMLMAIEEIRAENLLEHTD